MIGAANISRKAPPMSEAIFEKFMAAAVELDGRCYELWSDERQHAIARALMAAAHEADEAATKRERERCAALAFSFVGEAPEDDAPLNVYDEAVNGIATAISDAILKGEA